MKVEVPPLHTQTRIASILSALDDKIELNRQTNATLEAIAQAIFKEWFVDFRFPHSPLEGWQAKPDGGGFFSSSMPNGRDEFFKAKPASLIMAKKLTFPVLGFAKTTNCKSEQKNLENKEFYQKLYFGRLLKTKKKLVGILIDKLL